MRYLKTIERKVRAILAQNEDARNDDMVLYLVLCNACLKDAGALPLAEIMTQYKYLGLPSFESVSRRSTNIWGFRALRASAGRGGSCRHGIQSLRGAAPYAKNGAQANTITADMPKNKEAAYGRRKTHQWRL